MKLVVKLGSSSVTSEDGRINNELLVEVARQLSQLVREGHQCALVTSGAIASGLATLGLSDRRALDISTLQAVSAVGQIELMVSYKRVLESFGLVAGQVLLAPTDFYDRTQYLHARQTLHSLHSLGVIPIINENDAVANDEIRFGDNDRLAALVANLIGADLLLLLTDLPGVFTSDPKRDLDASLIEEISEVSDNSSISAGGPGNDKGSGGMASKLQAVKMASWSGVDSLIALASRSDVILDAVGKVPGVGTYIKAKSTTLSARKLWIAFATAAIGAVIVDLGARRALEVAHRSLLPAGIVDVVGEFPPNSVVEVVDSNGVKFAKGMTRIDSQTIAKVKGLRLEQVLDDEVQEVIHRDDLVLFGV